MRMATPQGGQVWGRVYNALSVGVLAQWASSSAGNEDPSSP